MNKYSYYLYIIISCACASVAMPTGGPKDETPPELVSSNPSNNQKNFSEKNIELIFNEDVKLKDPKEEILITPTIGKETKFSVKKKKVIIEPELSWSENTTYSLNFREGIQDLTEGNAPENLRLAFSTGSSIDSLEIFGRVEESFSEKKPEKITVAIYQSDTFNIFNDTPVYFTKTNKKGQFVLPNLKAGQYYIYAFDDKNKNLKVDSKSEKFSFQTSKIVLPNSDLDSIQLSIFNVDARPLILSSIRYTDQTTRIRFNKQVDSLKILNFNRKAGIFSFGDNNSEVIVYQKFTKEDSIQVKLIGNDSVGYKIDTLIQLKYSQTKTAKESFKLKEINSQYDYHTKKFINTISFNKPIDKIIYDSIRIVYDSTDIRQIKSNAFSIDTITHTLTFNSVIETILDKKSQKPVEPDIVFGKGWLISNEKDSARSNTIKVNIPTEEDSGIILINIQTSEPRFQIQLLNQNNELIQTVNNLKEHSFRFLKPEEYKIRILIDKNGNGKWDPGNFEKKIEPEKIIKYKSDEGKYNIPVRANWEIGPLLIKF